MILIGDENIPYETIQKVNGIDGIGNTQANAIVLFDFNINTLKHTQTNDIKSAVKITTIQELIYASSLGAFYILPTQEILLQSQKIANNYMFDSRILATIIDASEIEKIALDEIDGAIYKHLV